MWQPALTSLNHQGRKSFFLHPTRLPSVEKCVDRNGREPFIFWHFARSWQSLQYEKQGEPVFRMRRLENDKNLVALIRDQFTNLFPGLYFISSM
jgi:hypothetical protein